MRNLTLPGQRTLDGVDNAGELCEIAVAHSLDNATPVLGDRWIDDPNLVRLQRYKSPRLVLAHETRVAHQVCVEHCREATLHPQFLSARGTIVARGFAKYYYVVAASSPRAVHGAGQSYANSGILRRGMMSALGH